MRAASPSLPVAFELLHHRLRQEGFPIGVDHQLALQELLDRIGPSATPADLKTLLCPIFAVNAAQQAKFYEIFDQVFPVFHATAASVKKAGPEAQLAPSPAPPTWKERLAKRSWLFLVAALALCGLIAAGIYYFQEETPVVAPNPGAGQSAPLPSTPQAPEVHSRDYPVPAGLPSLHTDAKWHSVRWVMPVAPVLLFGSYWLFRKIRHRAAVDRQSSIGGPHFWPVQLEDSTGSIFAPGAVRQVARLMRRREEAPDLVLDVPATIWATIRGGGFPRFRYRPIRRPPEYLVFIERESAADHFAAMISGLMRLLQADGVFLNYYYFTGDPRRLTTESGDDVWLPDLAGRTPGSRALLFGPSGCILHPVSGKLENWVTAFERWPFRGLLVTDAPRARRLARVAEAGVCVCEASLEGLCKVIDHFEAVSSGGSAAAPPFRALAAAPDEDEMQDDGDLKHWIAASAVYPELNWNLSLRLAKALHGAPPLEERASRLARAPWFRSGEIPGPLRQPMWNSLSEPARTAVQKTLAEMLHEQKPPSGSIAFESWRHALRMYQPAARSWQQRLRSLLPGAEDPAPAAGQRDLTLLRFLEWKPAGRFSFPLGERLRGFFFENGLRTLGLRNSAWLSAAVLASALIVAVVQPWKSGGADYLELAGEIAGGGDTTLFALVREQGAPDTRIPIEALGGAFHTHIPADAHGLQVVSTLWPAPSLDVKKGNVRISVSPHRSSGALNFVSLSETTPGELVAVYEGACSQVRVDFGGAAMMVLCPLSADGNFTPTPTGFIYPHDPKFVGEFLVRIEGEGGPVERKLKVGRPETLAEPPPEIVSFTASVVPGVTRAGTRIAVNWKARNGVDFWLDRDDRGPPPRLNAEQDSVTIATMARTVTLTLRVENGVGKAQKTITVAAGAAAVAETSVSLTGPTAVTSGSTVFLKYSGKSVRGLSLVAKTPVGKPDTWILRKPGTPAGDVDATWNAGNITIDTTYELAEEGGTSASWNVKAARADIALPVIDEFSSREDKGGLLLTWRVSGAVAVVIVNSSDTVVANSKSLADSVTVPPAKGGETYTLSAFNTYLSKVEKSLSVAAPAAVKAPSVEIDFRAPSDEYQQLLEKAGITATIVTPLSSPATSAVEYSADADAAVATQIAGLVSLPVARIPGAKAGVIHIRIANKPAARPEAQSKEPDPYGSAAKTNQSPARNIVLTQIKVINYGSAGKADWVFSIAAQPVNGKTAVIGATPAIDSTPLQNLSKSFVLPANAINLEVSGINASRKSIISGEAKIGPNSGIIVVKLHSKSPKEGSFELTFRVGPPPAKAQ